MKKLFVVLLFLASGITKSMGQSMLKVGLRDNTTQISVSVDNRYFNKKGTSITVGELPFGRHSLKIYTLVYDRRGRGHEDVIYEGTVKTYNGMITILVFDPTTEATDLQETEIDVYMASHPASNRGRFSGTSQGDYDSQYSKNGTDNNGMNNSNQNNATNNNKAIEESSAPVAIPIAAEKLGTLTDTKTEDLKKKVAAKATDTQKMTLLKDELKNEKVTTNQVADIMDWLTFDASKVEFAKWAYSITADKEYFSDLESKFSYKTSQDDLDKFIKENH